MGGRWGGGVSKISRQHSLHVKSCAIEPLRLSGALIEAAMCMSCQLQLKYKQPN